MAAPEQVHIATPGCGHAHSTNCWCEPKTFYWLKGEHGEDIYVVEHNDETVAPHEAVIMTRGVAHDWVTTTLDGLDARKDKYAY